jgi:uncharacterized protein YndB with AHSA1/START domain
MSKGITARVVLYFNAPVAAVWDALTKPELVKQYLFGSDLHTTWEVGTPILFTGEWEGAKYEDRGTVLAFEPLQMLTYDYWSSMSGTEDTPDHRQTITYRVAAAEGGTQLTIVQENVPSEESREHSEANWKGVLEGMRALVEVS